MAPQSRGRKKPGRIPMLQSLSTPTLPTFQTTSSASTSPSSPQVSPTTTTSVRHPALSPTTAAPQPTSPRTHSLLSNDISPAISSSSSSEEADFQSHYSPNYVSSPSASESDSDASLTPLTHPPPRRPASLPHNSSLTALSHPSPFAPPFYNRPPTPLPPSPSLTSLLRPTFSTTNSRPTTPDSSDAEPAGPNPLAPDPTETSITKSARTATTVPRASPKVPTYEYYGFVLYLVSSLAFLIYILWSYLPSPFLHQLGISYYPNRWWSLAIPAFLVMGIVYIYVALASYNTGYLTLPLNSIENMVDEAANVAAVDERGRVRGSKAGRMRQQQEDGGLEMGGRKDGGRKGWRELWSEGTDAVMDVPVGGVCEILYGEGRVEGWSDDEGEGEG